MKKKNREANKDRMHEEKYIEFSFAYRNLFMFSLLLFTLCNNFYIPNSIEFGCPQLTHKTKTGFSLVAEQLLDYTFLLLLLVLLKTGRKNSGEVFHI